MSNRIVVITGGSSGIGLATCKVFSEAGDTVLALSRRGQAEYGEGVVCDITNTDSIKNATEYIINKYGRIDVLVNNAGMGISGAVETQTIQDIRKQFDTNLFGTIQMTQAVLPYMRNQKSGRIINTSSVASRVGIPFQAFYSASKSAIDCMSFALNAEVREFGIRVTDVLPGDTKTGFTQARIKQEEGKADIYATKMQRSVAQMEKDEQNGMTADKVAKTILKVSLRKNPPIQTVVGFQYKVLCFLIKLLPIRLANFIIRKMYVK